MSIYADTQTPSQFARMVNAVAGIVVARTREVFQLIKNRRDAATLASLDERMLADIGLTRGDRSRRLFRAGLARPNRNSGEPRA